MSGNDEVKINAMSLLIGDLILGRIPLVDDGSMDAEEAFLQRPEFSVFTLSEFKQVLRRQRKATLLKKERDQMKTVKPWKDSDAKKLLRRDIKEGAVPLVQDDGLTDKEVYLQRPEFVAYPFERFEKYIASLRAAITSDKEYAARDDAALARDRLIHPQRTHHNGKRIWYGSDAERLLKEVIARKEHLNKTPMQLFNERVEYRQFTLEEFRKHIHQEERSSKFKAFYADRPHDG